MSPWRPAHSPKLDAPGRLDQVNAKLLAEWRARKAAGFKAVDPYPRGDRFFLDGHLANRRMIARAWLSPAMVARRRRDRLRQSMRLIRGGRS